MHTIHVTINKVNINTSGGDDTKIPSIADTDEFFTDDDIKNITHSTDIHTSPSSLSSKSISYHPSYYNTDNILDLRSKIQIEHDIPIYCQHLYIILDDSIINLGYRINIPFADGGLLHNLKNGDRSINGIRINTQWRRYTDDIKIECLEYRQTLAHILALYNTKKNRLTINVIDLRQIFHNIKHLDQLTISLFYSCIIMPYYPMIASENIFSIFLSNQHQVALQYTRINPSTANLYNKYNSFDKLWNIKLPSKSNTFKIITILQQAVLTLMPVGNFVLYLTNIFNILRVSDAIPLIILYNEVNNMNLFITKVYKKFPITDGMFKDIALNTLTIYVKINDILVTITIHLTFKITIALNLSYYGIVMHKDTLDVILTPITKYINELIDEINSHGILTSSIKLPYIYNSMFVQTRITILFKINKQVKCNVREVIDKFITAGILIPIHNKYIIAYGMYHYNDQLFKKFTPLLSNQYIHLSNGEILSKWIRFILATKTMEIRQTLYDLSIIVNNIKEDELYISKYIVQLFLNHLEHCKMKTSDATSSKTLKELRERDPKLYKLKEIYGLSTVYSKLCQKPNQPISYYEYVPGSIKYRNFTTGEDLYYKCPNKQYPYLHFITGIHPLNYCLPCCKKTLLDSASKRISKERSSMYSSCMNTGTYIKHKELKYDSSKYITSYTTNLAPGRICKLPEDTLAKLLNRYFNSKSCTMTTDYFMYGVSQQYGAVHFIVAALRIDIKTFIEELFSKLDNKWTLLLDGTINLYFTSIADLKHTIHKIFLDGKFIQYNIDWDKFMINILQLYWGINIIMITNENDTFSINMPVNISDYDDLISDYDKHIICIEVILGVRNNRIMKSYYPIFILNTTDFFKLGKIETTVFDIDSDAVSSINAMISYELSSIKSYENIDMRLIRRFVLYSKFWIAKVFINTNNQCYAVLLGYDKNRIIPSVSSKYNRKLFTDIIDKYSSYRINSKNSIYISLYPSSWSNYSTTNLKYSLEPVTITDSNNSFKLMDIFINAMNKYITIISKYNNISSNIIRRIPENRSIMSNKLALYPYIIPDVWISYNDEIIGFMSKNLIFYMPLSKSEAMKYNKASIKVILYDYRIVNKSINSNLPPSEDIVSKTAPHYRIHANLYNTFIIEFTKHILTHRNIPMRKKIYEAIKMDATSRINKLHILLAEYTDDFNKISSFITNTDKDMITNIIKQSYYSFDEYKFPQSKEECVIQLRKMIRIPNIDRKTYDNMIDILAADIINPLLHNILFVPLLIQTNINNQFNITDPDTSILYGVKQSGFKYLS